MPDWFCFSDFVLILQQRMQKQAHSAVKLTVPALHKTAVLTGALQPAARAPRGENISYMSAPSTTLSPNPWARILDALEKKINRHSYDTWLKPTRYSHSSGGILFVRVPTVEFRHAGDKYADLIQEAIDNLGLGFNDVKFVTPEDDPAATPVRHDGGLSALRP